MTALWIAVVSLWVAVAVLVQDRISLIRRVKTLESELRFSNEYIDSLSCEALGGLNLLLDHFDLEIYTKLVILFKVMIRPKIERGEV